MLRTGRVPGRARRAGPDADCHSTVALQQKIDGAGAARTAAATRKASRTRAAPMS
jgi:hypothetical protein